MEEGHTTQCPIENEKKKKGQTTIHKTLHRKLEIEHHKSHKRQVMKSGAEEGLF
jgi:hypothetical protein